MGARNVAGAYAMYPDVKDRAHRLLVGMSLTALDDDTPDQPARRYFGGWRAQAELLGIVDLPQDDGDQRCLNAYEAVRRALRVLTDRKAIERIRDAVNGGRSEFLLHVDPTAAAVDRGGIVLPFPGPQPQRNRGAQPQTDRGAQPQTDRGAQPQTDRGAIRGTTRGTTRGDT